MVLDMETFKLVRLSTKRNGKASARIRLLACLAVFFLAFTLLLQDGLSAYQMEINFQNYGRWFAWSADDVFDSEAMLIRSGTVLSGSQIYLTHPVSVDENDLAEIIKEDSLGNITRIKPSIKDDNGEWLPPADYITVENEGASRSTEFIVGSFSDGFAEHNNIELYEGRMPESSGEIAVELAVLRKLGLSYELGQQIVFYIANKREASDDDPSWVSFDDTEALNIDLSLTSYKLVGTIKRYTSKWNNAAYNLPSAIISEYDFRELNMNSSSFVFYDLAAGYSHDRVWETAAETKNYLESITAKKDEDDPTGAVRAINTNAYSNPLWGSALLFKGMTWLLLAVSTCILAYLIATYLGKRRPYFMRIREIGASVSDVIKLAAGECLLSTMPIALAAIAAAYLLSLVSAALVSLLTGIRFFYTFRLSTLITVMLATAGTLVMALAAALILFAGRGIAEKKKQLSNSAAGSFRRRAEKKAGKEYLGFYEILKRSRKIRRVRTAAIRLICILASAVILFSFMTVYSKLRSYRIGRLNEPDFIGDYYDYSRGYGGSQMTVYVPAHAEREHSHIVMKDTAVLKFSGGEFYSSDYALNRTFFDELDEIPGIKSVTKDLFEGNCQATWESMDEDPFFNYCIELTENRLVSANSINTEKTDMAELRRHIAGTYWRLLCYEDAESVWKLVGNALPKGVDKGAFLRGEQVILAVDVTAYAASESSVGSSPNYMPMTEYWEQAEDVFNKLGTTLKPGVKLTVEKNAMDNESRLEAVIAGVIPMQSIDLEGTFRLGTLGFDQRIFSIIGSSEFSKRMLEAEGKEPASNYFTVEVDERAESENTAKYISMLCSRYGIDYIDGTETQREDRAALIDAVSTYGTFGSILAALLIFVLNSFAAEDRSSLYEKIIRMKEIGYSNRKLRISKCLDAAKQSLWLLMSIPVYIVMFIAGFIHRIAPGLLEGNEEEYSTFKKLFADKKLLFDRLTWDGMLNLLPIVIIVFLLMLSYWLIYRRSFDKYSILKKGAEE